MKKLINIALFLLFLFFPLITLSHPGNTASDGCHYCRTNCASWGVTSGARHCHNAKSLPQPSQPIKSTYGEGGTGYTQPAPEYEKPINTNYNLNTSRSINTNTSPQVLGSEYSEPTEPEENYGWLGWVFSIGAAGVGGYWLAKKKN